MRIRCSATRGKWELWPRCRSAVRRRATGLVLLAAAVFASSCIALVLVATLLPEWHGTRRLLSIGFPACMGIVAAVLALLEASGVRVLEGGARGYRLTEEADSGQVEVHAGAISRPRLDDTAESSARWISSPEDRDDGLSASVSADDGE